MTEEALADTPDPFQPYISDVTAIFETVTPGYYMVNCTLHYTNGHSEVVAYALSPTGDTGFAPLIRQWMAENPNFPITPYVEPPPAPYSLAVETLWGRMTDDEAEQFGAAMATASPLRLRKMFGTATSMDSTSELFGFVKGVLTPLFGVDRTTALMAQQVI